MSLFKIILNQPMPKMEDPQETDILMNTRQEK